MLPKIALDVQFYLDLAHPAMSHMFDPFHFVPQMPYFKHKILFRLWQPLARVNSVQKHEKLLAGPGG
jgi:hypothetical protein